MESTFNIKIGTDEASYNAIVKKFEHLGNMQEELASRFVVLGVEMKEAFSGRILQMIDNVTRSLRKQRTEVNNLIRRYEVLGRRMQSAAKIQLSMSKSASVSDDAWLRPVKKEKPITEKQPPDFITKPLENKFDKMMATQEKGNVQITKAINSLGKGWYSREKPDPSSDREWRQWLKSVRSTPEEQIVGKPKAAKRDVAATVTPIKEPVSKTGRALMQPTTDALKQSEQLKKSMEQQAVLSRRIMEASVARQAAISSMNSESRQFASEQSASYKKTNEVMQRRMSIAQDLQKSQMTTAQLAKKYNVSQSTIKRDTKAIADAQKSVSEAYKKTFDVSKRVDEQTSKKLTKQYQDLGKISQKKVTPPKFDNVLAAQKQAVDQMSKNWQSGLKQSETYVDRLKAKFKSLYESISRTKKAIAGQKEEPPDLSVLTEKSRIAHEQKITALKEKQNKLAAEKNKYLKMSNAMERKNVDAANMYFQKAMNIENEEKKIESIISKANFERYNAVAQARRYEAKKRTDVDINDLQRRYDAIIQKLNKTKDALHKADTQGRQAIENQIKRFNTLTKEQIKDPYEFLDTAAKRKDKIGDKELKKYATRFSEAEREAEKLNKRLTKTNKINGDLKRSTSIVNTKFGSFSIIMSGIAATLFVWQQLSRAISKIIQLGIEAEETFNKLKRSISESATVAKEVGFNESKITGAPSYVPTPPREQPSIRRLYEVARAADASGTMKLSESTDQIIELRKAGYDAAEALDIMRQKFEMLDQAAGDTAKRGIEDLKGSFREMIRLVGESAGPALKKTVDVINEYMHQQAEISRLTGKSQIGESVIRAMTPAPLEIINDAKVIVKWIFESDEEKARREYKKFIEDNIKHITAPLDTPIEYKIGKETIKYKPQKIDTHEIVRMGNRTAAVFGEEFTKGIDKAIVDANKIFATKLTMARMVNKSLGEIMHKVEILQSQGVIKPEQVQTLKDALMFEQKRKAMAPLLKDYQDFYSKVGIMTKEQYEAEAELIRENKKLRIGRLGLGKPEAISLYNEEMYQLDQKRLKSVMRAFERFYQMTGKMDAEYFKQRLIRIEHERQQNEKFFRSQGVKKPKQKADEIAAEQKWQLDQQGLKKTVEANAMVYDRLGIMTDEYYNNELNKIKHYNDQMAGYVDEDMRKKLRKQAEFALELKKFFADQVKISQSELAIMQKTFSQTGIMAEPLLRAERAKIEQEQMRLERFESGKRSAPLVKKQAELELFKKQNKYRVKLDEQYFKESKTMTDFLYNYRVEKILQEINIIETRNKLILQDMAKKGVAQNELAKRAAQMEQEVEITKTQRFKKLNDDKILNTVKAWQQMYSVTKKYSKAQTDYMLDQVEYRQKEIERLTGDTEGAAEFARRERTKIQVDVLLQTEDAANGIEALRKKTTLETTTMAEKTAENMQKIITATQESLSDGFFDFMQADFETIWDLFDETGNRFVKMIDRMVADYLSSKLAQGLFGSMTQGGTGGGWAEGLIKTIIGGFSSMGTSTGTGVSSGSVAHYDPSRAMAATGAVITQPTIFKKLASGGVITDRMDFYDNDTLKLASGGVITSNMVSPSVQIGEAGPEGVLPLTRMPDGKLGVASTQNKNTNTVKNDFFITVEAPDGKLPPQSMNQLQTRLGMSVQRAMRRNA